MRLAPNRAASRGTIRGPIRRVSVEPAFPGQWGPFKETKKEEGRGLYSGTPSRQWVCRPGDFSCDQMTVPQRLKHFQTSYRCGSARFVRNVAYGTTKTRLQVFIISLCSPERSLRDYLTVNFMIWCS